jgi:hypothetical protein
LVGVLPTSASNTTTYFSTNSLYTPVGFGSYSINQPSYPIVTNLSTVTIIGGASLLNTVWGVPSPAIIPATQTTIYATNKLMIPPSTTTIYTSIKFQFSVYAL